jgi:muconolactone delta-isomerase
MRVAIISTPRAAPPPEALPELLGAMSEWVSRYRGQMEHLDFFVGGGGMGVIDVDDSIELTRIMAEMPFTPFSDVEIRPVADPQSALQVLQEAFAQRAGS